MKSPPTSVVNLVDLDFIKNRARVIDVAAFLDRVERAGQANDFRVQALRQALKRLSEPGTLRARSVLEDLSDPSSEPIAVAHTKGATGACPPATP
jgi:hypothetical protein